MPPAGSSSSGTGETTAPVLRQLERICASACFRSAGRLRRFLDFVVKETLAGRQHELKEYVVGVSVFDKPATFDPRTDPIVRVQARRLRALLERYYKEEAEPDELMIALPKGGYGATLGARRRRNTRSSWALALGNHNTVAVSEITDYSAGGEMTGFAGSLRQELLCALAQLPGLRVLIDSSRSGEEGEPAGGTAHAAYVLDGSVRQEGGVARVILKLVETGSGCLLWSGSLEGEWRQKSLPLQREAAQQAASQVRVRLRGAAGLAPGTPTENLAARNLFLQGRYHLDARTEESLAKAVEFFERALREDPQYAIAHAGLADAYSLLGHYGVLAPAEMSSKAAANAATAVMLAPDSAATQTTLAHVKACQDWDWSGAERQFRHALQLDPAYATAHHWYATSCLAPLARLDAAAEEMRTAQSLDPVSPIIARDLAVMYMFRREYEPALEQCDHTIELNPHFSPGFRTLGLVQEQRQDYEEAAAAFQAAIRLSPNSPAMHAALGHYYALTGQNKACQSVLQTLRKFSASRYVSPFAFASIYLALGDWEAGFDWLDKACQDRCFELLYVSVDPRFDAARRHLRFASVMRKLGLGAEAQGGVKS